VSADRFLKKRFGVRVGYFQLYVYDVLKLNDFYNSSNTNKKKNKNKNNNNNNYYYYYYYY